MFPLRQLVSGVRRVVPGFRAMSSSGPLAGVEVDDEGIATVTMQRPPVNSLNLDLLQDLNKAFDEVSKNKCKALILTSSSPTVFSAGLDIMEMYKPDIKRAEAFWTTLQEVWIKLFGSNFITAAAINIMTAKSELYESLLNTKYCFAVSSAKGHAPAGGCLLAMSCEYRVMVGGKFKIGLNETALGIVAPKWFMDTMTNTIPKREAEFALTTARMFSVDEALKVGLIDKSATDKADSIAKCKDFIEKFDAIPPLARAITKQKIREAPLAWMQKNRTQDTQEFLGFLKNPKVQQALEMYIQFLKSKSAN